MNRLQLLYIRVPLYRCTSIYIGRGQVLFQNLFLTYPTPILGRIEGEFLLCKNIATAWNHRFPSAKNF